MTYAKRESHCDLFYIQGTREGPLHKNKSIAYHAFLFVHYFTNG